MGYFTCFWVVFVQNKNMEQEQQKQREIEALQNQLQQLKDMAAGKAVRKPYT